MSVKVKRPRDLYLTFNNGKRLVAETTYDRRGRASIRLYDPNEGRGFLMGSRSAKIISKWLVRASAWVKQDE